MNFLMGLGGSLLKAGGGYLLGKGLRALTRKAAPYLYKAMNPFDNNKEDGRVYNKAIQGAIGAGVGVFKHTFNHLGKLADPDGKYFAQVGVSGGLGDHFVNAQRQAYERMMATGGINGPHGMVRAKVPDQPVENQVNQI